MQETEQYEEQSDEQLAASCARGDQAAFAALYERYFQAIYDFAARTVRDADGAGDVVQNTFTKAWESMKKGKGGAQVKAWLYTIARNSAIDELRHRKRLVSADKAGDGDGGGLPAFAQVDSSRLANAQTVLEDKEMAELVWSSAAALSPKEYTLLDMHLRQGLSVDELAASLGLRKGNVYTMLSRLRDSLEESVAAAFLMRRGRRECAALDALLNDLGTTRLTRESRRAVREHVEQCARCQENQRSFVSPAEIFGSFAVLPAAPGLRDSVWQNVSASISAAPSQAGLAQRWAQTSRGVKAGIFGAIGAVIIAALAVILLLLSGGGGGIEDPGDVRSTSHEIGEPSADSIIRIAWSPHADADAFSFIFSGKRRELPDEDADLRGSATSVKSRPLDDGEWYFHMRTQGKDGSWTSTVHLGPFEIGGGAGAPTPEASPTPEDEETPTPAETATPGVDETATQEAGTGTPSPQPTATATPTPAPTTTPTPPPADTDGDGVPDNTENAFGSDPLNATSTPEHRLFDASTCNDGVDNDGDLSMDLLESDGPDPDAIPDCQ
jgi:RNA polymerase sigma-70 factor (ECF subfamily)